LRFPPSIFPDQKLGKTESPGVIGPVENDDLADEVDAAGVLKEMELLLDLGEVD